MEDHKVLLNVISSDLSESDRHNLMRELRATLRQQGVDITRLDPPAGQPGQTGDAAVISNIVLTLIGSGGVAVTLLQVLKSFVERKSSIHFEIVRPDGEKRVLDIENLKDAKFSATEGMISEFLNS